MNHRVVRPSNDNNNRSSNTLATLSAAIFLWLTFPLVTLTAQCFLTARPCTTRFFAFQGGGADFAHPLTAAALHLLLVGVSLWLWLFFWPLPRRRTGRRHHHHHTNNNRDDDNNNNDNVPILQTTIDRLRHCAPVGLAFGTKYVVGHWALQHTPAIVYELFHGWNLLFVALFAHLFLGEGLKTWGEVVGCVGVVVGSIMAGQEGFQGHGNNNNSNTTKVSILALWCLNIGNGMLAGIVVVLLRLTMLQCHGQVTQVTAYKMLIGALVLWPMAWFIEDGTSLVPSLTRKQVVWLLISSGAILVYHLSLGLLCWLATAPTVAIVEAIRPVPAFAGIALLQKMETKKTSFWMGSAIVLASAVTFQLSRRFGVRTRGIDSSDKARRTEDSTRTIEQLQSTEITGLLNGSK